LQHSYNAATIVLSPGKGIGALQSWHNREESDAEMEAFQFDWNVDNIRHLARHDILPAEAEQVLKNRPRDLEFELRNGEDRMTQVGDTDAGRILIVVSTMEDRKVRVVTAWPAKERLRRYFQTQKRNGNVGRIEKQDLRE
jgi:uncharacterized DUF497 family protein